MTPLILLANNTDSPINIAKDGFIAGYGSDCNVEYLADDWTDMFGFARLPENE